jgi:Cytochrome b5-like Heme/Steroid binding domain
MVGLQVILKFNQNLLRRVPRVVGSQTNPLKAFSTKAGNAEQNGNTFKQIGGVGLVALAGALTAGTVAIAESDYMHPRPESVEIKNRSQSQFYSIAADNSPPKRPDLPTISLEQVAEHSEEGDMWYTFRGAVYDMSFFLDGHPGGAPRLLMAAGQDLEPYWDIYRQHFRGQ